MYAQELLDSIVTCVSLGSSSPVMSRQFLSCCRCLDQRQTAHPQIQLAARAKHLQKMTQPSAFGRSSVSSTTPVSTGIVLVRMAAVLAAKCCVCLQESDRGFTWASREGCFVLGRHAHALPAGGGGGGVAFRARQSGGFRWGLSLCDETA